MSGAWGPQRVSSRRVAPRGAPATLQARGTRKICARGRRRGAGAPRGAASATATQSVCWQPGRGDRGSRAAPSPPRRQRACPRRARGRSAGAVGRGPQAAQPRAAERPRHSVGGRCGALCGCEEVGRRGLGVFAAVARASAVAAAAAVSFPCAVGAAAAGAAGGASRHARKRRRASLARRLVVPARDPSATSARDEAKRRLGTRPRGEARARRLPIGAPPRGTHSRRAASCSRSTWLRYSDASA